MPSVLLATCTNLPHGEPGGDLLLSAFADAGATARWAAWDDPDVDWRAADVVAARATWDYEQRRAEFLAWAGSVGPRLLHGADVFAWNTDKRYLLELADAAVPVVPTVVAETSDQLGRAVAQWGTAVVKPAVGAGGRGVEVITAADAARGHGAGEGPWIVQPLLESVRVEGERSVYVLGGEAGAQLLKHPAGEEIRVHETYGGRTEVADPDVEAADLAVRTVAAAQQLLGVRLSYARVDQLRLPDGSLAVGELEVTEPGLYLERAPQNAARFVAAALAAS
ncbi:hypothetical protein D9V37_15450 [Nocardioides mangrovicus]|uniref:ATP-grasp domain-containing protein n=1 Tax=Nocardioides mangrovicus TaxID=2478913 RepID=A0A3L8NY62_9ACTN|nr:hypothetical protein [Nocardioides mangrovicus]RLV47567.1 hypothetical protein D9V37_15450 [Nocardioides mangrovicus]